MTMAEANKLRYDRLRARHRCVTCTKRLPDEWRQARCRRCLDQQLGRDRERRKSGRQLADRLAALEAVVRDLRQVVDAVKNTRAA